MDRVSDIVTDLHSKYSKMNTCKLLVGNENLEEIIDLFFSPKGVEFCQKRNFPTIEDLRRFNQFNVEKLGVYIDSGNVTICNQERVMLIGNTSAEIVCDDKLRHEIIMMYGSSANIKASNWSVVSVSKQSNCNVVTNISDRAILL